VDQSIRQLIRQYGIDPTNENAHQLANAIVRAGGLPSEELKRFAFFNFCGDCDEPVRTFEICSYLGHNPGIDGHLYRTREEAERTWQIFIDRLVEDRNAGQVMGDYWTELPFETLDEELDYLKLNVRLVEFYITQQETP